MYYLLYANGEEMPSKVAFDPEEPSLGRIRVDSIAPPHSATTFKLCISRVERNPEIAYAADLYEDTSCKTPFRGHISLRTDGPGPSPNELMAIVLAPPRPFPGPDGKYFIKNRAANIYWNAWDISTKTVYFSPITMENARKYSQLQVNEYSLITQVLRR